MPNKPINLKRKHVAEIYVSMFLMMVFAVAIAVIMTQNYIEARDAAAADSIKPVCEYLFAQRDVYDETPPSTPTGLKLAESVDNLIARFGCQAPPQ